MANKRDYYEVLGVGRNSTEEEIKRAYRRRAMEYHPDRNKSPDAEARFKEVNEAYQVLSDPERRVRYDQFGHAGVMADNGLGRGFEGFDAFGGFGDIFESFFGGFDSPSAGQRPTRGTDLHVELTLTFEEAVLGTEKEVQVSRQERCSRCGGTRSEPGSIPQVCPTCRGRGQVRRTQQSLFGHFVQVVPCQRCRGQGTTITSPCIQCHAAGREKRTRTLGIRIPAGVEEGIRVRLPGEGDGGENSGPPGDVYIALRVQPHPLFQRSNGHILYETSINITEAALGGTIEVPTLKGPETLRIPPGTQPGTTFRLKGKGVPDPRGSGQGDQLVTVQVEVPQHLTARQKQLLQELASSLGNGDGSHRDKGRFGRFRETLGRP